MAHIETALADRAAALGVEIRRGCGVEGFDASGDGVSVHAGGDTIQAR